MTSPISSGDHNVQRINTPVILRRERRSPPFSFSRRKGFVLFPFLVLLNLGAETGGAQTPTSSPSGPVRDYQVLTGSELRPKETMRGTGRAVLPEPKSRLDRCDFSAYAPVPMSLFDPKVVTKRVAPEYPAGAVERGVQGRVVVKGLVNEQGLIERACAVEGEEILRRAAETAVLRWKLKPKYGVGLVRPVSQRNPKNFADIVIAFDFKLNNASEADTQSQQTVPASKREPMVNISLDPGSASSNAKLFPVSSVGGPLSKVGFIDASGKLVIDFNFYSADPFSEGLACVTLVRDGKEGYINAKGQVVIEPKFDWAFPFQERRAKVRLNGKWGYIDPSGNIVVEPKFEEADNFYEGMARVKVAGKWGYIDPAGKFVIPALFDAANRFSEGLACVLKNNRLGYLDRSGEWVIPAQFERMSSPTDALFLTNFKEGLAVAKKGGQYGYIDKNGQFAIPPYFDRAESFSEGLAPITIQNKMGYINKAGVIAVTPQFDVAGYFSEGLAEIAIDHKRGFIDSSGKIVIEPRFDLVMRFTNGLAYASVGRTAGYIDKRGKWVWVTNGE